MLSTNGTTCGVVGEGHDVLAVAALRREHAVFEQQRLGPGFERALLEPVGRLVEQLARGLQRLA